MVALYLVPVILSLLVLGAHFLRARNPILLLAVLAMLALLGRRRPWVAVSAQVVLVLGAIVWMFTLAALVERRTAAGEPVTRLALILGGVTLVTGLSALVFRTPRLRRWYNPQPAAPETAAPRVARPADPGAEPDPPAEPIASRSDSRRREIAAPAADVYAAISDPARLARWWGPRGFTSTFHEFEFRPGGRWLLTMHGPDGRDHPNESRFARIEPGRLVEVEHLSGHHFLLRVELVDQGAITVVAWDQIFDTVGEYEKVATFVAAANEQNLDRLAEEAGRGS